MDHAANFQKQVQFRVPETLSAAIDSAADKRLQSKSEYLRQSLMDRLKADEIAPASLRRSSLRDLFDTQINISTGRYGNVARTGASTDGR